METTAPQPSQLAYESSWARSMPPPFPALHWQPSAHSEFACSDVSLHHAHAAKTPMPRGGNRWQETAPAVGRWHVTTYALYSTVDLHEIEQAHRSTSPQSKKGRERRMEPSTREFDMALSEPSTINEAKRVNASIARIHGRQPNVAHPALHAWAGLGLVSCCFPAVVKCHREITLLVGKPVSHARREPRLARPRLRAGAALVCQKRGGSDPLLCSPVHLTLPSLPLLPPCPRENPNACAPPRTFRFLL